MCKGMGHNEESAVYKPLSLGQRGYSEGSYGRGSAIESGIMNALYANAVAGYSALRNLYNDKAYASLAKYV